MRMRLPILALVVTLFIRLSEETILVACPAIFCPEECPDGYEPDARGCPTCRCLGRSKRVLDGQASTTTSEIIDGRVKKVCTCTYERIDDGQPRIPCIKIIPGGVEFIGIPGLAEDGSTPSISTITDHIPALKPENLPPGAKVEGIPGGIRITGIIGLPGDGGIKDLGEILVKIPNLGDEIGIRVPTGEGDVTRPPVTKPSGSDKTLPTEGDVTRAPVTKPSGGDKTLPTEGDITRAPVTKPPPDGNKTLPTTTPSSVTLPRDQGSKKPPVDRPEEPSGLPRKDEGGKAPPVTEVDVPRPLPKKPDIKVIPGGVEIKGLPGLGDKGETPDQPTIVKKLPSLEPTKLPPGTEVKGIPGGVQISGIKDLPGDQGNGDLIKILDKLPGLGDQIGIKKSGDPNKPIPVFTDGKPALPGKDGGNKPAPVTPGEGGTGLPSKNPAIKVLPGGLEIKGLPGLGDNGETPDQPTIVKKLPALERDKLPPGTEVKGIPGGVQVTGIKDLPGDQGSGDLIKILDKLPGLGDQIGIKKSGDPSKPLPVFPDGSPALPGKDGGGKPLPKNPEVKVLPSGGLQIKGLPGLGDNGETPDESTIVKKLPSLERNKLPPGAAVKGIPGGVQIDGIKDLPGDQGSGDLIKILDKLPGLGDQIGIKKSGDPNKPIPVFPDGTPALPGKDGGNKPAPVTPGEGGTGLPSKNPAIKVLPGGLEIKGLPGLGDNGETPDQPTIVKKLPALERDKLPPGAAVKGIPGGVQITGIQGLTGDQGNNDLVKILDKLPGLGDQVGIKKSGDPSKPIPVFPDGQPALPEKGGVGKPLPGTPGDGTITLSKNPSLKVLPGGLEIKGIPGVGDNGETPDQSTIVKKLPALERDKLPLGASVKGIPGGVQVSGIKGLPGDQGSGDLVKILEKLPGLGDQIGLKKSGDPSKPIPVFSDGQPALPGKDVVVKPLPKNPDVKLILGGLEIKGIPGLGDNGETPDESTILKKLPSLERDKLPPGAVVKAIPGGVQVIGIKGLPGDQGTNDLIKILEKMPELGDQIGIKKSGDPSKPIPVFPDGKPVLPGKDTGTGKPIPVSGPGEPDALPSKGLSIKPLPVQISPIQIGLPGKDSSGKVLTKPVEQGTVLPGKNTGDKVLQPSTGQGSVTDQTKQNLGGFQLTGIPGLGDGGKIPSLSEILAAIPALKPENLPATAKVEGIPGGFKVSGIPGLSTDGSSPSAAQIVKAVPGLGYLFGFEVTQGSGGNVQGGSGSYSAGGLEFTGIGDANKTPDLAELQRKYPALRPENLPKGGVVEPIPGGFRVKGVIGLSPAENEAFAQTLMKQVSAGGAVIQGSDELLSQIKTGLGVPDWCGKQPLCRIACENGYAKDLRGCPICACR